MTNPQSDLSRPKRWSAWLGPCLSIAILFVALWFLHNELNTLSKAEIIHQLRAIPVFAIIASTLCMIGSYSVLTVYDGLAIRYLQKKWPTVNPP